MVGDLLSVSIDVENFALVTHKVPAERVRRHVPERYELQTFEEAGEEFALVSATCFCNRDFRPTALQFPRHSFNESTYRTYITYQGHAAVFFFCRFLGTALATLPQKTIDRNVYQADFEVDTDLGPAGFTRYVCRAAGPRGETYFSLEATREPPAMHPFTSGEEHEQFITYRLDGHFTSTVGTPAHGPVSHGRMRAWSGHLQAARFDPWEELGIVTRAEAERPYSVLVTPGTTFRLQLPRPAL